MLINLLLFIFKFRQSWTFILTTILIDGDCICTQRVLFGSFPWSPPRILLDYFCTSLLLLFCQLPVFSSLIASKPCWHHDKFNRSWLSLACLTLYNRCQVSHICVETSIFTLNISPPILRVKLPFKIFLKKTTYWKKLLIVKTKFAYSFQNSLVHCWNKILECQQNCQQ